jgi:hypothetical protein
MWPFETSGGILALYLGTLALHAVFVSYVVAGTAYVLVRKDAVAATVRDRLPFMLGCGITAGVAPLLFVQLLHQRRFYTANLLLGPRWGAVVPALVLGFYALYIAKTSERWKRPALAIGLGCFAFVAYSWSELHELMEAEPAWREFYAAGHRIFLTGTTVPRFIVFGGAMTTLFALVAAWSAEPADRRHLAILAIAGRIVSIGGAIWLWRAGFDVTGPALAWLGVLVAATVLDLGAWAAVTRRPTDRVLAIATAAGAAAVLAAVVVREAPRVALIEPAPAAGGLIVFLLMLAAGGTAIAWVVRKGTYGNG